VTARAGILPQPLGRDLGELHGFLVGDAGVDHVAVDNPGRGPL
jgi:hypothetical protein